MTTVEKIEKVAERRWFLAAYRFGMAIGIPMLLALQGWHFSTTLANNDSINRLTGRVETLERSDAEFKNYRDRISVMRNEQYSNLLARLAAVETLGKSIEQTMGDVKADVRELRRSNERQGLLLPGDKAAKVR